MSCCLGINRQRIQATYIHRMSNVHVTTHLNVQSNRSAQFPTIYKSNLRRVCPSSVGMQICLVSTL